MNRSLPLFSLYCPVVVLSGAAVCAAQERGKGQYHTTQLELQSQLMRFADHFGAILGQAQYEGSAGQPDLIDRTEKIGENLVDCAFMRTISPNSDSSFR